MTTLGQDEILRYSRHIRLPEIGIDGQKKLKEASVLIVGLGGLGSPAALYLAAAGIGKIGLVDFDVVEYSNLQRQIIHTESDVGRSKLNSAKAKISAINSEALIDLYELRLASDNAIKIFENYDIIIDGTDNFPTRYLVNDACVLSGRPFVFGSIYQFEGQVSIFADENGPCYRCLFPAPPSPGEVPNCEEGGVIGILPGVIGTIQATEAIKLLLGLGDSLKGRLLLFDALKMTFRTIKIRKNSECVVCGDTQVIKELIDYEDFCGLQSAEVTRDNMRDITVEQLRNMLDAGKDIFLLDVRELQEYEICRLDNSHLLPMGNVPSQIDKLDASREIVVYCHLGIRSRYVQQYLSRAGFRHVWNLAGGINAWAHKIDHSMPKY